jgi:hypothetical protein
MTSEIRRIRLMRGTQTEWDTVDPVLRLGEIGLEMDSHRYKVGDGTQNWADLTGRRGGYWIDAGSQPGAQGPQGPQGAQGATIIDGGGP